MWLLSTSGGTGAVRNGGTGAVPGGSFQLPKAALGAIPGLGLQMKHWACALPGLPWGGLRSGEIVTLPRSTACVFPCGRFRVGG